MSHAPIRLLCFILAEYYPPPKKKKNCQITPVFFFNIIFFTILYVQQTVSNSALNGLVLSELCSILFFLLLQSDLFEILQRFLWPDPELEHFKPPAPGAHCYIQALSPVLESWPVWLCLVVSLSVTRWQNQPTPAGYKLGSDDLSIYPLLTIAPVFLFWQVLIPGSCSH